MGMHGTKIEDYKKCLLKLKAIYSQKTGEELLIQHIITDAENSLKAALAETFPLARQIKCNFHLPF